MKDRSGAVAVPVSPTHVAELGRLLGESVRRRTDELADAVTSEVPFHRDDVLLEIGATARYLETHLAGLGQRLAGRRPICAPDELAALMLPANILASGIRTITDLLAGGNRVLARMTGRARRTAEVVQAVFDDVVPGNVVLDRGESGPSFLQHALSADEVRFLLVFGGESLGDDLLRLVREGSRKRVVFEGPGKDPVIVLSGADLDEVARITARSKLAVAGQRCVAPENVVVEHSAHDALVERLVTEFEAATIGSVISPKVPVMVRDQLADAETRGARIACGGTVEGQHVAATIVTGVTPDMAVFQDETFAPLLAVASCAGPVEAVEIAASGRFGLACCVFGDEADQVAAALRGESYAHPVEDIVYGRYGHVVVNNGLRASTARGPFGGYGKSGWIWDGPGLRQGPKLAAFEATLGEEARPKELT